MKNKKQLGMKTRRKSKAFGKGMSCEGGEGGEMGYAKGGSVKKGSTARGMGAAKKGGSFSGCY